MIPDALHYLATPYSKFPDGIEAAFVEAAKLTGRLLRNGVKVYSPIAHTHPVAIHGGIDPLDHDIWLPFDRAMIDASGVLIVAHLQGWDCSKGIAFEVDVFEKAGKPIFDLEPETLSMVRRTQLPPSLRVKPNIPQIAPGFASAKAADDFRAACQVWIDQRQTEALTLKASARLPHAWDVP